MFVIQFQNLGKIKGHQRAQNKNWFGKWELGSVNLCSTVWLPVFLHERFFLYIIRKHAFLMIRKISTLNHFKGNFFLT